jgi:hypothetical protein
MRDPPNQRRILGVIFSALLIDILAFTIILPLLPRLLAHYDAIYANDQV